MSLVLSLPSEYARRCLCLLLFCQPTIYCLNKTLCISRPPSPAFHLFFFDLQAYKEAVSAAPEAQVTTLANGFRVATEQVSEISKYVQLCSLSVKRKRESVCV